jgi:hypothetical protein
MFLNFYLQLINLKFINSNFSRPKPLSKFDDQKKMKRLIKKTANKDKNREKLEQEHRAKLDREKVKREKEEQQRLDTLVSNFLRNGPVGEGVVCDYPQHMGEPLYKINNKAFRIEPGNFYTLAKCK